MRKLFLITVVLVAAGTSLALVYAVLMVRTGFSARATPSGLETYVAKLMRRLAIPKDADQQANPAPRNEQVLHEAMEHWADHCAVCHALNGSGNTTFGQNMYPPPPDMRTETTQEKSDGELFYIIQNGIRLSGMPAWGEPGHEEDTWKLVNFIRHLPQLTPEEEKWMEQFVPKSPEEIRQQQAEEEFLSGGEPREQGHHH